MFPLENSSNEHSKCLWYYTLKQDLRVLDKSFPEGTKHTLDEWAEILGPEITDWLLFYTDSTKRSTDQVCIEVVKDRSPTLEGGVPYKVIMREDVPVSEIHKALEKYFKVL